MSETLRIADEKFKESLNELREAEEGSEQWYKALLKRDRAVFQRSRANMIQEIYGIRNRKNKEIDNLRKYVHQELQIFENMVEMDIDHKHLLAKIQTVISNVLYDEF